jgi:hypothetical protein
MADQDDVVEFLCVDRMDDVGDVGVEIDRRADQMGAIAQAGQGQREDLVAVASEACGQAAPAPGAVNGAGDETILAISARPPPWRPDEPGAPLPKGSGR